MVPLKVSVHYSSSPLPEQYVLTVHDALTQQSDRLWRHFGEVVLGVEHGGPLIPYSAADSPSPYLSQWTLRNNAMLKAVLNLIFASASGVRFSGSCFTETWRHANSWHIFYHRSPQQICDISNTWIFRWGAWGLAVDSFLAQAVLLKEKTKLSLFPSLQVSALNHPACSSYPIPHNCCSVKATHRARLVDLLLKVWVMGRSLTLWHLNHSSILRSRVTFRMPVPTQACCGWWACFALELSFENSVSNLHPAVTYPVTWLSDLVWSSSTPTTMWHY